jgi:hypothetical protein
MATGRRPEETISRWLEAEAPTQLPDRVLRATFERTRTTRQQGAWRAVLWRIRMPRLVLVLGGVAAVVIAAVVALNVFGGSQPMPGVGGQASPSPSPPPSAAPVEPSPDAALAVGPFALDPDGVPITVTIPASGWTFNSFGALVKGDEVANLPESAMLFWAPPAGTSFYVPGDPCQATSTRPATPATTIEELAAALAAQASRDATGPVDVTFDGHAGKSITLRVPADASPDGCEGGEFVSFGTEKEPILRYHQGPGQIDQIWIVDVDGAFLLIDAMYRPDTPGDRVEEMQSIAGSTTFASTLGGAVQYQLDGAAATTEVDAHADGAVVSGTAVTTLAGGTHTVRLECAGRNGETWALAGTTVETTVAGERAGDWSAVVVRDGTPQQIGIWFSDPKSEGIDCSGWLAAIDLGTIDLSNFEPVESGALVPPPDLAP